MNWKGVMPAITTSFTEDLRYRPRLHGSDIASGCWRMAARASSRWVRWARAQPCLSKKSCRFCVPASSLCTAEVQSWLPFRR